MSTGLIIAIVVVVLLLLALLLFVLPRARARARERDLERRRGEVADAHRGEAETRQIRAQQAEQVAARERAEANLHETRASMHERGLADDDLEQEHDGLRQGGNLDSVGDGTAADRGGSDARMADTSERGGAASRTESDFERGREVGHDEAAGGDDPRMDRGTGAQRDDRV